MGAGGVWKRAAPATQVDEVRANGRGARAQGQEASRANACPVRLCSNSVFAVVAARTSVGREPYRRNPKTIPSCEVAANAGPVLGHFCRSFKYNSLSQMLPPTTTPPPTDRLADARQPRPESPREAKIDMAELKCSSVHCGTGTSIHPAPRRMTPDITADHPTAPTA